MYDPLLTISSLLQMVLDIVGTTFAAIVLPTVTLIIYPALSILQWLAGGA